MDNAIVINNIKQLRKTYNLTQQELADRISFGRSTIGQIESGHSNPTDQLLNSISLVFGINNEWLETGQGPMKKSDEKILEEAINLIEDISEAEIAFLKVMAKKIETEENDIASFYKLINSLLAEYQQADRNTQGYITVQLKKTFPEYLKN